jgi:hypothetical protein
MANLMGNALISFLIWSPFSLPGNNTTKSRNDKKQRLSGSLIMANYIHKKRE